MGAKLRNTWENLKASLWFEPSLLVVAAIVLSFITLTIDTRFIVNQRKLASWLFGGTPEAAQALLIMIAGTLVTSVSIAFSITIVAIQLASTQFSPRVLRTTLTDDRGNHVVLGAYIATFVYALLILRQTRNPINGSIGFVPVLSIAIVLGLALVCLGLLIYFIHHISELLQVAFIIDRVHKETIEEIQRLYPAEQCVPEPEPAPIATLVAQARQDTPSGHVVSQRAGYLRNIDEPMLFDATDGMTPWLWVRPCVGEYIPQGSLLIEWPSGTQLDPERLGVIQASFVLDNERSLYQDPLFGVRQLVDIALKALSPAINDPTTSEYSLSALGDIIGRLAQCRFQPCERRGPRGQTRYFLSGPTWADFVDAAFSQIRRQAANDVHVTAYLLSVLQKIAPRIPSQQRFGAMQHQVDEVRYILDRGIFSPSDTAMLRRRCDTIEAEYHTLDHATVSPHSP